VRVAANPERIDQLVVRNRRPCLGDIGFEFEGFRIPEEKRFENIAENVGRVFIATGQWIELLRLAFEIVNQPVARHRLAGSRSLGRWRVGYFYFGLIAAAEQQ